MGAMAGAIAKQYPGIRCTCFDLPSAVQGALNTFRESGVADRCEFLVGDLFVEVPAGADAYLISGVRHNWEQQWPSGGARLLWGFFMRRHRSAP
jgi:hypothetical protein